VAGCVGNAPGAAMQPAPRLTAPRIDPGCPTAHRAIADTCWGMTCLPPTSPDFSQMWLIGHSPSSPDGLEYRRAGGGQWELRQGECHRGQMLHWLYLETPAFCDAVRAWRNGMTFRVGIWVKAAFAAILLLGGFGLVVAEPSK
jgi:hypothetical protein